VQLSQEEQRVVALFAAMPPDAKVRFPTWFVELVVPMAMAIGGWLTGHPVFVGAAFGGLLVLHAHRLFRQFKYARELHSIFTKLQAHTAQSGPNA
jgi:hypothetical protein